MYLNSSLKSYEIKYRKYKSKYNVLKNYLGGNCDPLPNPEEEDFVSRENLLDLCPEERITIQNKCYEVKSLYKWIITDNNSILPGSQTVITEEEKQILIQVYEALPKIPISNILTRSELIKIYPNLQHETYIDLSNRDYTSIAFNTFAKGTFGDNLPALKILNLSGNNIEELQPGIFNNLHTLKILNLSNNKIKELRLGIFDNLSELQSLDLFNNNISVNGVLQLGLFDNLKKLEKLYLSNNGIRLLQSGIFNNLPVLIHLYLDDNQISIIEPYAFNNLPTLTLLYLNRNQISIFQQNIFNNLSNLSELRLEDNHLELIGGVLGELQLSTFNNLPQLQTLFLNNNLISNISSGSGNQLLSLKILHLEYNQIREIQRNAFINLPELDVLIIMNDWLKKELLLYDLYFGLNKKKTNII
jgi:Leucine-rich repeat (LRR) protein